MVRVPRGSDLSSLSCWDQCCRAESCEAFSWLPLCSGLFTPSTSSTVCLTELSLCVNPGRSSWQLCSRRKTLQCLTGWQPLPGGLNSGKSSSSWTKHTKHERSGRPSFRAAELPWAALAETATGLSSWFRNPQTSNTLMMTLVTLSHLALYGSRGTSGKIFHSEVVWSMLLCLQTRTF